MRPKVLLKKWPLIALPLCLIIFPVTLRNYLIGDDWVLISANGGVNFYIGNNAHYDSTVAIHPGLHWERLVGNPLLRSRPAGASSSHAHGGVGPGAGCGTGCSCGCRAGLRRTP